MSKLSQKQAVFNATKSVLADAGHDYEEGMDVSAIMNDNMRKAIITIVTTASLKGEVELKDTPSNRAKLASEPEMKKYVSGLVSNWFRKDQDLNGGVKYQIKKPGSRAGATDPQLKALRQLHTQFKGTPKEAIIKAQIDARTTAIQQEKASKVTVDVSVLSPELRKELGLE